MDVITVEITVPAAGRSFDLRLPHAINCQLAAYLAAQALADLTEGSYSETGSAVLVWKESGRMLNVLKSLEEEHVLNGSKLLLI